MFNKKLKNCVEIHRLLRQCISFEHIEDRGYIQKKLKKINEYRKCIPPKMYSKIIKYIETYICPIILDGHYFDFAKTPEVGFVNNKGCFEIKSKEGLVTAMELMNNRCFMLGDILDELFLKRVYKELTKE